MHETGVQENSTGKLEDYEQEKKEGRSMNERMKGGKRVSKEREGGKE